jgi:hypothetical protein
MESRMAASPQDEVRMLTDACKPAIPWGQHLASVRRRGMPQMLCNLAMAPLLGVPAATTGRVCLDAHRHANAGDAPGSQRKAQPGGGPCSGDRRIRRDAC